MRYRNGRPAVNGDRIVSLTGYGITPVSITAVGVLHGATHDDDCNGTIVSTIGGPDDFACLCNCLHMDDLVAILAEKGLDKRPAGE